MRAPVGYRLRNSSIDQWIGCADEAGLQPVHGEMLPGDVLLLAPGAGQSHLAVFASENSVVHAHAGLGRIVRQPLGSMAVPKTRWRLDDSSRNR
ncbi:MAG: hypothetical protein QNJ15_08185 [Erythrobacter sp.]|nr:hypothetical protein [Erythrobacter sp.]